MKIFKIISLLLFSAVAFISCEKDDEVTYEADRQTIVRIKDSDDLILFARNVLPAIEEFTLIDLRRDATRPSDMSQPLTVKLQKDPAILTAYNAGHGTSYVELPSSAYTLSSDITNLQFAAGQDVITVNIRLDKSGLDLTKQYALAFKIAELGAGAEASTRYKEVIYVIGVKNKYDGIYSVVSGNVTRYTAPGVPAGDALSGSLAGNPDVVLATAGPNSVSIPPPGPGSIQWAAGNNSYVAGINGLVVTVDPLTNNTTITSSANATLANWAGKDNKYDPASKTFYLAFRWNPTTTPREYEIVLKYKGPR